MSTRRVSPFPSEFPVVDAKEAREQRARERSHGVDARNAHKLARAYRTGCRVWDRTEGLCGNEAIDAAMPVLMCRRHAAEMWAWFRTLPKE